MNKQGRVLPAQAQCVSGKASKRLMLVVLASVGLSACAMTPMHRQASQPAVAPVAARHAHAADLQSSYASFAQGQDGAALTTLDGVINDPQSAAGARRDAFLAKALIHANGNATVRDSAAARAELRSAAALNDKAGSDVLALYFANAIDRVLTADAQLQKLQAQTQQLTRDKADLSARNDDLTAQKAKLKLALEKLKQVTLGG